MQTEDSIIITIMYQWGKVVWHWLFPCGLIICNPEAGIQVVPGNGSG